MYGYRRKPSYIMHQVALYLSLMRFYGEKSNTAFLYQRNNVTLPVKHCFFWSQHGLSAHEITSRPQ